MGTHEIRLPKADVPQSVFSLNLSWNFENGATLRKVWPGIYRTMRYTLCLQVGVGLYVGVGLDPTLRLGSDVSFLPALRILRKLGNMRRLGIMQRLRIL